MNKSRLNVRAFEIKTKSSDQTGETISLGGMANQTPRLINNQIVVGLVDDREPCLRCARGGQMLYQVICNQVRPTLNTLPLLS